jgi:hypothetical protein
MLDLWEMDSRCDGLMGFFLTYNSIKPSSREREITYDEVLRPYQYQ